MASEVQRPRVKTVLWTIGAVLVLLAGVFLVRRYVPSSWTSAQRLGQLMRDLDAHRFGPVYTCTVFALLASAFMPVTALITASALVFDPARAFTYALCGSLLSAALSRGAGQLLSGPVLRRMSSPRLQRFREQLHAHTFSATIAARLLPLGNFTAINMLAGAVAVPWWPFLLGNLVGMVFGISALTLLAGRLRATFAAPTPANIALAAVVFVLVAIAGYALTRFMWRRQRAAQ